MINIPIIIRITKNHIVDMISALFDSFILDIFIIYNTLCFSQHDLGHDIVAL